MKNLKLDESVWIKLDRIASKLSKNYIRRYCWNEKETEFISLYSELEPELLITNIFGLATTDKYLYDTNSIEIRINKKVQKDKFPQVWDFCTKFWFLRGCEYTSSDLYQTIITFNLHPRNSLLPKRRKIVVEITDDKNNKNITLTNQLHRKHSVYDITPLSLEIIYLKNKIEKLSSLINRREKQNRNVEKEKTQIWKLFLA